MRPARVFIGIWWFEEVNKPVPVDSGGRIIHRRVSRQAAIVMVNGGLNGRRWAEHIKQRKT